MKGKKLLAFLMSASLTLTSVPFPAFAAGEKQPAVTASDGEETMPTSTAVLDYYPVVDFDISPMGVGWTRRLHVEDPQTGNVAWARMSSKDESCYEWYFDMEASDIVIMARKPCDALEFSISAAGCAFSWYGYLTIVPADVIEPEVQTETTMSAPPYYGSTGDIMPTTSTSTTTSITTLPTTTTTITTLPTTTTSRCTYYDVIYGSETTEMTTTTVTVPPCYQPEVDLDESPMYVGETRRIHVTALGKVSWAEILNFGKESYYEWYFDEEKSDIVLTALKACNELELNILAEKCYYYKTIKLTIVEKQTTAPPTTAPTIPPTTPPPMTYTTTTEPPPTETMTETTTEIGHGYYQPDVTFDDSPMYIGETRRMHVTAPGKVAWAKLFTYGGDDSCYEWYFDEATSDVVITALDTCYEMELCVIAEDCEFYRTVLLTIVKEKPTEPPMTDPTIPPTTPPPMTYTTTTEPPPTTEPTTTTTVIADYAPYVTFDESPMYVGEERRMHVEHPRNGFVARASLYSEDKSCYEWYFDEATSDIVITALKPCNALSLCVSASGCVFDQYVDLTIREMKETDATEPPIEAYDYATEIEADKSPMHVGEVRAVRFYDPETGDAFSCHVDSYTKNFSYFHEEGSDIVYITALRAGTLQVGLWTGTTAFTGLLTLEVLDGDSTESGKKLQKLGNINGDDVVDAGDATNILKEAARFGTGAGRLLSGEQLAAADVNFDGKINAEDATIVLIYAAIRGTAENPPEFAEFIAQLREKPQPAAFYGAKCIRAESSNLDVRTTVIRSAYVLDNEYGFLGEDVAAYDDDWFEKKNLIVLQCAEPSGSIWLEVTGMTTDENGDYIVHITRHIPEIQTTDMAYWYVLVETNNVVWDAEKVSVEYTDDMPWLLPEPAFYGGKCIRTDRALDYGARAVITDAAELEAYFSALDEELADDIADYDDAYFAEKNLLILQHVEDTSSNWLELTGLSKGEWGYKVHITLHVPEFQDGDMQSWYILVETDKTIAVSDAKLIAKDFTPERESRDAWVIRQDDFKGSSMAILTSAEEMKAQFSNLDIKETDFSYDLFDKYNLVVLRWEESNYDDRPEVVGTEFNENGDFVISIQSIIPISASPLPSRYYILVKADKSITDVSQVRIEREQVIVE